MPSKQIINEINVLFISKYESLCVLQENIEGASVSYKESLTQLRKHKDEIADSMHFISTHFLDEDTIEYATDIIALSMFLHFYSAMIDTVTRQVEDRLYYERYYNLKGENNEPAYKIGFRLEINNIMFEIVGICTYDHRRDSMYKEIHYILETGKSESDTQIEITESILTLLMNNK